MTAPVHLPARPAGEWQHHAPHARTHADPCTAVILGAAGDLAKRKLLPALYQLAKDNLLAEDFAILGVAREDLGDEGFREAAREALATADEVKGFDEAVWETLRPKVFFAASGDFTKPEAYDAVRAKLELIEARRAHEHRNRMFYLSVPPSVFEPIVRGLSGCGLAPRTAGRAERPWTRVVIEKPFGRSLDTAQRLNALTLEHFAEHQVYRIDHYLGKETVQNLLVLRFANSIFEPLWNRQWVSHVQITAAETVGVEGRGKYYEESGVIRDMFQNHLLQLLTLTAMEPPSSMSADAVRDEKVKVLRSIRWLTPETIPDNTVFAQYERGAVGDRVVTGFRDEPNVAPRSATPTYAAVRMFVDNWRWKGVPFYLRSGKRMAKRVSEIAVQFHRPPHLMFGSHVRSLEANVLVMRVQPNEGVHLRFEAKVPGAAAALTSEMEVTPVEMDFNYQEAFGDQASPAYQTLLLDVMIGEATLFTRSDEVEAQWRVVEPLIAAHERSSSRQVATYAAGTWGPADSEVFIARDGHRWRTP